MNLSTKIKPLRLTKKLLLLTMLGLIMSSTLVRAQDDENPDVSGDSSPAPNTDYPFNDKQMSFADTGKDE